MIHLLNTEKVPKSQSCTLRVKKVAKLFSLVIPQTNRGGKRSLSTLTSKLKALIVCGCEMQSCIRTRSYIGPITPTLNRPFSVPSIWRWIEKNQSPSRSIAITQPEVVSMGHYFLFVQQITKLSGPLAIRGF